MDKTAISYIKLKDNLIAHMEKAQKYIRECSRTFTEQEYNFMFTMGERAHYGDNEIIVDDKGNLKEVSYLENCINDYKDLVHSSPDTPWASDAKPLIDKIKDIEITTKNSITRLADRESEEKNHPINKMVENARKEEGLKVSKEDTEAWKAWIQKNNICIHPYKEGEREEEAAMDRLYNALKSPNASMLFNLDIEYELQDFIKAYIKEKELGPSYFGLVQFTKCVALSHRHRIID